MKIDIRKIIMLILMFILFGNTVSAHSIIGLENFEKNEIYYTGRFLDVSESVWYAENVKAVSEYGLMNGVADNAFAPNNNITLAETITLAVRLNHIYVIGYLPLIEVETDTVWYTPYVDDAVELEIISEEYLDYNISATRAEFAKILAASIDPVDFEEINVVDDGAIPDVSMDVDYAEAVYLLYRAGVLTGSDANGTFNPDSTITRAEAAAIVTRIVDPSLRKSIELVGEY